MKRPTQSRQMSNEKKKTQEVISFHRNCGTCDVCKTLRRIERNNNKKKLVFFQRFKNLNGKQNKNFFHLAGLVILLSSFTYSFVLNF